VDFEYVADVIDTARDAGVESARHTFDRSGVANAAKGLILRRIVTVAR